MPARLVLVGPLGTRAGLLLAREKAASLKQLGAQALRHARGLLPLAPVVRLLLLEAMSRMDGACMPISSLVLTLDASPELRARALSEVARDPRITVGTPLEELWLPVVTETGSLLEGEALAESLRELPGVSFVDVVLVDFSEEER
jgi:hypothetical protein